VADTPRSVSRRDFALWLTALLLVAAGIAAKNLIALAVSPPGMYVDESSIGYNAWTLARFGVDEHGIRFPLYFEAFGEYKNPVYVYTLSALLHVLPLTPFVERTPAALFGFVFALSAGLIAWRVSGSRLAGLSFAVLAELTPWVTQESRVGFEVVSMVALLGVAIWCLCGSAVSSRRFAVAGLCLMLAIVAYSTGRLEVLLFSAVFLVVYRRSGMHGWWRTLVPVAAGYGVVGVWALLHPGALTAEFSVISIGADHPSVGVLLQRFFTNYISYFSPTFLFEHGDSNLRHNTGYTGMLLVAMAPLLVAGAFMWYQRRREPFVRWLVICLLLGPVSAALTNTGGEPHALRGAVMLPFWFALAAYGVTMLREYGRTARVVAVTAVAAGVAVQAALYLTDMYTAYPARAAVWFDTGALTAMRTAESAAAGHSVWVSATMEAPYIQAFFALMPSPPSHATDDSQSAGLAQLRMHVVDAAGMTSVAEPGDVMVLDSGDVQPGSRVQLIALERGAAPPGGVGQPLLYIYRVTD
jgi:hypothetical protein